MAFVTTPAGVSLHYDEAGAGRPVVFLHGWAMSGRVWHFQRELADSNRIIFMDQRGHGQSSPAEGYAIEDFADDLASLFEQLSLDHAVLVGWSLGVQVALQAFPALGDRLSALVLVGGTPRFTTAEGYPHGKPAVEVKGLGLRLKRDYQKTMGDFFKGMFADRELDQPQYQRIVHEIVMAGHSPNRAAAMESLQILSTVDQRDLLREIDRPVLLVHGELDTICPVSASEYMAEQLSMAELRVFGGCGHAPFMTHPKLFGEILRSFLARV